MTETAPSARPLSGSEDQLTDPIGLALTAIGAGATAGAFVITTGVSILRLIQPETVADGDPVTTSLLTASVLLGPVVGAATTMSLTRRIPDVWRRSVAAAIAVFCTFLLSGLSAPIDMVIGTFGPTAFATVLLIAAIALTRRAMNISHR